MAPSQMALRSPVYHFYYSHLHFHISYLHFLCRYKSGSLWLIRPLCARPGGPEGGITAYRTLCCREAGERGQGVFNVTRFEEKTSVSHQNEVNRKKCLSLIIHNYLIKFLLVLLFFNKLKLSAKQITNVFSNWTISRSG